jgi:hypothetical protein
VPSASQEPTIGFASADAATGSLDPEPDHRRISCFFGVSYPIQQQIHASSIQKELERVDYHLTQLVGHHRHRRAFPHIDRNQQHSIARYSPQPRHEFGLISATNKHRDHHLHG